jgi:hypothetical protein
VALSIGAVPVAFALEMNPEDGYTLEHGFLLDPASVPLLYGAPVETGRGTTRAVLTTTTTLGLEEVAPSTDGAATCSSAPVDMFPDDISPDEALVLQAGDAVSVFGPR